MSTIALAPDYGHIVGADETHQPSWLVDDLVSGDGLTAITGASKTGKTTLAIETVRALMDPRGHQGQFIGKYIEARGLCSVLVIATHGQHEQYTQAFAGDGAVKVVAVSGVPGEGCWTAYADLAEQLRADLVVIDVVQALAGAPSVESLAGLMGFKCPVLGVFSGYAGTAGISGDEYRSLAIASIWVNSKNDPTTLHVVTRWCGEWSAPWTPARPAARSADDDEPPF